MNINIPRKIRNLAAMSLLAWSTVSAATNVSIGGVAISIPAPDSFSQSTTPTMLRIGELSTPNEDHLLAVFARTAALEEAKGGRPRMDRYAYVQSIRLLEPRQIPLNQFAKYKSETKVQVLAGLSPKDRVEMQKNFDQRWKAVDSVMGATKSKVDVPQVGAILFLISVDPQPTFA